MKHYLTIVVLLLLSWNVVAQKNLDKVFASKSYSSAAQSLESKVNKTTEDLVKIATAYRLNHNTLSAEHWYSQVVEKSSDPIHKLHFAQALQSNGKFDVARKYYIEFDKSIHPAKNDSRGKLLAEAIERMEDFEIPGNVTVRNLVEINSEELDFSPVLTHQGVVFVSNRSSKKTKKMQDGWINGNFMNLFVANYKGQSQFGDAQEYNEELLTNFHEGPFVFSKNSDRLYFTRNQLENGKKRKNDKEGILRNDIFLREKVGDEWTNEKRLSFNTYDYEEVHPTISLDENLLIFASDRPGGYGGMDLYYVEKTEGEFLQPVNLGPKINTPGNEVFPHLKEDDETLYFSSDGWGGVGGLDIFRTKFVRNKGAVTKPKNVGTPLNSTKDDFGIVTNVLGNEGYFSSARVGGKGKDDIYYFYIEESLEEELVTVSNLCFTDEISGKNVAGVSMQVFEVFETSMPMSLMEYFYEAENFSPVRPSYQMKKDDRNRKLDRLDIGKSGQIKIQLIRDKKYLLKLNAPGYEYKEFEFAVDENGSLDVSNCVQMEKSVCLNIEGRVFDKITNKPIPFADIEILEACLEEKTMLKADKDGFYELACSSCNCEFLVKASMENYIANRISSGVTTSKCYQGGTMKIDIGLETDDIHVRAPKVEVEKVKKEPIVEEVKKENLAVGSSLELKNIFYDFNKSDIREGARVDLDYLVTVLNKYPSMIIELSSHTDARGNNEYNQKLSQNRANAAVNYLIQNGISERRLLARGYGESRPRNQCADGVRCSEEEHQFNRRTEIKILKLEEEVDVKYMDNFPKVIDRIQGK